MRDKNRGSSDRSEVHYQYEVHYQAKYIISESEIAEVMWTYSELKPVLWILIHILLILNQLDL